MEQPVDINKSNIFNHIYAIATMADKEHAKHALGELVEQGVCLDVMNTEYDSPAERLAAEGNFEAVELLQLFDVDLRKIARGTAQNGNTSRVKDLIRQRPDFLPWIAQGLARGGHEEWAETLRAEYPELIVPILAGVGSGLHQAYASRLSQIMGGENPLKIFGNSILLKEKTQLSSLLISLAFMENQVWVSRAGHRVLGVVMQDGEDFGGLSRLMGFALGGQIDYLLEKFVIPKYVNAPLIPNATYQRSVIAYIARGLAASGHLEDAEALLELMRILPEEHYQVILKATLEGATVGGYHPFARSMLARCPREQHHELLNIAAASAAEFLHWPFAEELRREGTDIDQIAKQATRFGDQQYLERLVEQGANVDSLALNIARRVEKTSSKQGLLSYAMFFNHPTLRNSICDAVLKCRDLSEEGRNEIPQIKRTLNHVHYLKNEYILSLPVALAMHYALFETKDTAGSLFYWFLHCYKPFMQKLPEKSLFFKITRDAFSAFSELSYKEVETIADKVVERQAIQGQCRKVFL